MKSTYKTICKTFYHVETPFTVVSQFDTVKSLLYSGLTNRGNLPLLTDEYAIGVWQPKGTKANRDAND